MTQWIAVAIILAICVLYVCRAIRRRRKNGGCDCSGCAQDCPHRREPKH